MPRFWRIRGFDGTTLLLDVRVPVRNVSLKQMKELLRALASRSLTPEETIGAYARRGSKFANDLVKVSQQKPHATFMSGENPHYIANVVDENGKPQQGRYFQVTRRL